METFEALAEYAPFGIFFTDAGGAVTHCNSEFARICGLSRAQAMGFGRWDVLHPRDRARVLAAWEAGLRARREIDVALRIVRQGGERRYLRMAARPLAAGGHGGAAYLAFVHDITDQIMAERRLRNNNRLLTAVLENIPCGVTVYDGEGALVLDNQRARAMLNLPEDSFAPVSEFGTVPVEAAHASSETTLGLGSDDLPRLRSREEAQPDGRILEVRDASMPGGGLVTTYTDITQHKLAIESWREAKAAADKAAAAKAEFLAIMSHEIRTPMNGVIGMTNVLLETNLDADQRDLVEIIRESGESLMVVINDVLDFSRIDSGQMELEWLPLRPADLVAASVRLVAAKANERKVAVSHRIDPAVPAVVYGDKTRLQQVLVNLLSNAVKFAPGGEVCIHLRNGRTPPGRSASAPGDLVMLAVSVSDNGIGIARERLESVFEPFVQADSSTARKFGGTGLGLAIAKRLVEAMGGSISIDSVLGSGTTVTFDFLAEAAPAHTRARGGEAAGGGAQAGGPHAARSQFDASLAARMPLRILLAEDNEINRKVALRMLRDFGYTATVAVNGREALEAVRAQDCDLVLMDMQMPVMDGVEATARIVAELPAERRPCIVAMSANVMREHVDAALSAGADDYVGKPFSVGSLRAVLEKAAARRAPALAAASAAPPAAALLETGKLRTHFDADGSGEFLDDLLRSFAEAAEATLSSMHQSRAAANPTSLAANAHELAGVAAVMGATSLADACLALELRARKGELDAAVAHIEECARIAQQTLDAMRALCRQWRADPQEKE